MGKYICRLIELGSKMLIGQRRTAIFFLGDTLCPGLVSRPWFKSAAAGDI